MKPLALLVVFCLHGAAYAAQPALNTDMADFPKWVKVIPSLYEPEEPETQKKPSLAHIKRINARVNKVQYRDDAKAYKALDYWATPQEFFEKGGDCEDYVIAKYNELLKAGMPDEDMLLLVVGVKKDNTPHALLQVKLNGKTYLLDNRSNKLYTKGYLKKFTLMYGINRMGWVRDV